MSHRISVRLEEELDARRARMARLMGRSKSFYVRQALAEQIEDLEDLYVARMVSRARAVQSERSGVRR